MNAIEIRLRSFEPDSGVELNGGFAVFDVDFEEFLSTFERHLPALIDETRLRMLARNRAETSEVSR